MVGYGEKLMFCSTVGLTMGDPEGIYFKIVETLCSQHKQMAST